MHINEQVDFLPETKPDKLNPEGRKQYHFISNIDAQIQLANSLKQGDIYQFTMYLHALQDSFSHSGYDPWLGHIYAAHGPDKYCPDSERDTNMRIQTMRWLRKLKAYMDSNYSAHEMVGYSEGVVRIMK